MRSRAGWGPACGTALLLVALALAGCQAPNPGTTPAVDPAASLTPLPATEAPPPTATPVPTQAPPKELTVCMAEEPNTLFIYGNPSRAARNVLEAIYDGPVDTRSYSMQPVILTHLPSLAGGDAAQRPVQVAQGARVVDRDGQVVTLQPGVTVWDGDGQPVAFEGQAITTTQMVVTFTLRPDVTWSDGTPLTAGDSVYSLELASARHDALPLRLRLLEEQTESYVAADEHTVVWTSIPGYHDTFLFHGFRFQNFYYQNFYSPLPRHAWGTASAEWIAESEAATRAPLGWGPFVVEEWVQGDHLTLTRNPAYFRAAEGLPYLDRIHVRFVADLDQGVAELLAGECDMITQDVLEREETHTGSLAPVLEAAGAGQVALVYAPSSEWEHLDFNVNPAEWVERPKFFGDVQTRQAVAMCIHRERIAGEAVPYSASSVADTYVASNHPLYAGDRLHRYAYDPSAALALLDEVGWHDQDGDGIREAHGISGIREGTPFSVTLLTNSGHLAHERTARILTENLAACGIGLAVEYMPAEQLFADGPDGPVFGRSYDLVLFSWLNDLDAPCWLYMSSEIPSSSNWWAASNNPGYSAPDFDAACATALVSLADTAAYRRSHIEAQRILSRDVPVVPLYFVPKLVVTRPGVHGVELNPTQYLDLWNIEAFDIEPLAAP